MVAFFASTPQAGIQPIHSVSVTTQNHPLGTLVKGIDATQGEGEFIYLNGVASNIVGAIVTWNPIAKTVTLVTNTAALGWPVGVSMAANTSASSYSWYQVGGCAQVKKTAAVVQITKKLCVSATPGAVISGSTAGKMISGALTCNSVASAATYCLAIIDRPCMEIVGT